MRVWQLRDWLVYAQAGVYLTCASLYCTFRPILPTAAIAQWALQGAQALWHRSCVRIPWWYYNFLPAGLRVEQPCRYCFYSLAQKRVFRPAGATRCPDKREIWHGERTPVPNFTFIGRKCGNTAPKTVKISNFGQRFVLQGRLDRLQYFYEILSICTRL